MTPLEYLEARLGKPWLVGYPEDLFYLSSLYYYETYQQHSGPILIPWDIDRVEFLAKFIAAVSTSKPVFLTSPNCKNLSQPNNTDSLSSCIMIPTGGTLGQSRFAKHNWQTLIASVEGFKEYYNIEQINSFCLLPFYHVSGLMQALRTLITGGKLVVCNYATVKSQPLEIDSYADYFISLVPTQLKFMMEHFGPWLQRFGTVLLGGAPPWPCLLESARLANIPLALTYGMTETASQIVALRSGEFLGGNSSSGVPLPHARITIEGEKGEISLLGEIGTVVVESNSLFLGYYPDSQTRSDRFYTDDLGYFDQSGYLHIVGRKSQKIITGGEKLYPKEVEDALLNTGLLRDVLVMGYPDSYWGEIVTAIYVAGYKIESEQLKAMLSKSLVSYKLPKKWLQLDSIPRNEQGKVNIKEIENLVRDKAVP